jgi:hypothetical protein
MRLWTWAALVVAALIGLRHASIACEEPGPLGYKDTRRLRDGDAHALFTRRHLEVPGYGQKASTEQRLTVHGDIDYRCDGYCTFGKPKFPEGVVRVPVGETYGSNNCYGTKYICKRGRPSRCRRLARLGSTTTTTLFDRSFCPTTTTIQTGGCSGHFPGVCNNGGECLPTGPNGDYECQHPGICGAANHYCGGECPPGQACGERPVPAGCYTIGCECQ